MDFSAPAGTRLWVSAPTNKLRWFDPDSGVRLDPAPTTSPAAAG
jgi:hypothetical protein